MSPATLRRLSAAGALLLVIAAGLGTRMLPPSAFSDIAGDALYAVAAYTGLILLAPRLPWRAAAALAAVWCLGIEFFQLTGVPLALARSFPPAGLVLGSGFDPRDLVVAVVAVAAAAGVDVAVSRARRSGTSVPRPRAVPRDLPRPGADPTMEP